MTLSASPAPAAGPGWYSTRVPPPFYALLAVVGAAGFVGGFLALFFGWSPGLLVQLLGLAVFGYGMAVSLRPNFYGLSGGVVVDAHHVPAGGDVPLRLPLEAAAALPVSGSWTLVVESGGRRGSFPVSRDVFLAHPVGSSYLAA